MIEDRCQSGSNCNDLSLLHAFPDYRTLSCLLSCVSTSSLTRAGSVKPDTKNKTIKHGGGGGEVKGALPCFVYIRINAKSQFHKSCTVAKNEIFWWATGQSNLEYKQLTAAKSSKVQFSYTHTLTLWPMEQSSILSAEFHCPVARQNISFLATAHDWVTRLLTKLLKISPNNT